jgi:hypothetical protein
MEEVGRKRGWQILTLERDSHSEEGPTHWTGTLIIERVPTLERDPHS